LKSHPIPDSDFFIKHFDYVSHLILLRLFLEPLVLELFEQL